MIQLSNDIFFSQLLSSIFVPDIFQPLVRVITMNSFQKALLLALISILTSD